MTARTLMVLGTMSSAGKSLLVTALCRIYARRGLKVVPFKAQNMSNNAAVCVDGSEIGRAQYTQALACGVEPVAAMNPILLKPEAGGRSQVVVMGRAQGVRPAGEYARYREALWGTVTGALDSLRADADLVIMEGAGSPVELNLSAGDIVNMAVAKYAQSPVLLVGDIDRGGVFAQLLGTLWLLEPDERALVKGLVVNKFRGLVDLFADGVAILEERGGVPVLGVVPFLHHHLPEEDAVAIEPGNRVSMPGAGVDIAVIRLPRISNFDDFDPLDQEPGVNVRYVDDPAELGRPSAVILPGSKSTIADRRWLAEQGFDAAIRQVAAAGRAVVGICGGYQILGTRISDPDHTESDEDAVDGLGLLPVETVFAGEKATHQASATVSGGTGWLDALQGQTLTGYEIHMGQTGGPAARRWLTLRRRDGHGPPLEDGAISEDGRIWGCYLHGLFAADAFRWGWLRSLGWRGKGREEAASLLAAFDGVADGVEAALDMARLDRIIGL